MRFENIYLMINNIYRFEEIRCAFGYQCLGSSSFFFMISIGKLALIYYMYRVSCYAVWYIKIFDILIFKKRFFPALKFPFDRLRLGPNDWNVFSAKKPVCNWRISVFVFEIWFVTSWPSTTLLELFANVCIFNNNGL